MHLHIARNVMLKFQKKLTSSFEFLHPQENVMLDASRRTESWRD